MSRPVVARLYRALLRILLPRSVRARDGGETARTFEAMWANTGAGGARVRVLVGAFGRLPVVALAEWLDLLSGAWPSAETFARTLWQAARSLRRAPAFTWSAVALLAIGVGAATTIFTVVDHVLLRSLPYPDADRLFLVEEGAHSGPDWRWFQTMPSVDGWLAVLADEANLTGDGDPIRVAQGRVTSDFFALLGARPALGRLLVADDDPQTAVISHPAWVRLFGADPGVIGRTVRLDGLPMRVVGVVDGAFVPPDAVVRRLTPDLWRPLDLAAPQLQTADYTALEMIGRRAPWATPDDVARDAEVITARRAREIPDHYVQRDGTPRPMVVADLRDATTAPVRQGLDLLLAATTLLLLVACANVAHLFMARGIARGRELAVRRALGAGAGVIAQQLLAESLVVALGGATAGIALAWVGLRAFLARYPTYLPRAAAVELDPRVIAFALALACATALAFGLLPALRVARQAPGDPLRGAGRGVTGGRSARALRGGLVVAEVALSLVLVAQSGLLLRSFARLRSEPLGFRVAGVWTLGLRLPDGVDAPVAQRRIEAVRDALAALPGVRAASYGLSVPMQFTGGGRCCWNNLTKAPASQQEIRIQIHPVAAGWSDVYGPALRAGRFWTPGEADGPPFPAVMNEALAVAAFGSAADALGKEMPASGNTYRVAGVIATDRHYGPDEPQGPALYVPISAVPFPLGFAQLALRVDGDPAAFAQSARRAVWSVEPNLPVPDVRPMQALVDAASASRRFDFLLFGAFGVVALLLAAGGLCGTLLYTVGLERRELGIRLALGARRLQIEGRVLRRGLGLAALGVALGTAGALASGRLLASRLYGVAPNDPATLTAAVAVLLLTATVACWVPARRAATTDPLETLREE